MSTKHIVAVYLQDRAYGGPEEGGWWYGVGEQVRILKVFGNETKAVKYNRRLNRLLDATLNRGRRPISSVLSDGIYRGEIYENNAPQCYPTTTPRFE